ncbi:MAG: phosphoribosylamine--glycine ligase [Candidatus Omnitrophica bacterium]|jgi:phosphoribosylamine--glycine ligase|nr:phosphoribosylamine--glycine ligase [Candidatus Omnitrophota bacterium]
MKVLVIGSGGREHALCWKLAQSRRISKLYCAPGNGGIAEIAECVNIKYDDINALLDFAVSKSIELTVVGPEAPLTIGIIDAFNKRGLRIFGPDKASARLESSKVFAKKAMKRFGIKTADFAIFNDPALAEKHIQSSPLPIVIKADGLCAGKGVIVAGTKQQALSAVKSIMLDKEFGPAGENVIIEQCLKGEEASIILVSDGRDYVLFPTSQDHKRVFDNDKGPNTGGMGAYSPAPVATDGIIKKVENDIIRPLLDGLRSEGNPYKGVLYIGLMIIGETPYVLEFNVRFGDPETQAILPRLKTDLVDIFEAALDNKLGNFKIDFDPRPCVSVVLASGGYPGPYKQGLPVSGLNKAGTIKDVFIFHAGTRLSSTDGQSFVITTSGGRVLGVTAMADTIDAAIRKSYAAAGLIAFEGMHFRKDIGFKAVSRGAE